MLPFGRTGSWFSHGRLGYSYLFSSKCCPPPPPPPKPKKCCPPPTPKPKPCNPPDPPPKNCCPSPPPTPPASPCCPPPKPPGRKCCPPRKPKECKGPPPPPPRRNPCGPPPPPPPPPRNVCCPPPPPPAPPSNTYCPDPPPRRCTGKEVPLMETSCKIALITGGTSGIGFGIAQQLLCTGLKKAVLASNSPLEGAAAVASLNQEFGQNKAVYYDVDVNCNKQFEALMRETISRFSRIDIMVNSAGMINDRCWDLEIDTNLKATARGTILAMKYMAKGGLCNAGNGGVVLNVTGISGMIPTETAPVYSASNHGVIGLTRSFGDPYHYKKTCLRVLALCSGVTTTAQLDNMELKSLSAQMGVDTVKKIRSLPLQRSHEVGKAAVHVLKFGTSSSCYIVEAGEIFHFTFPEQHKSANFLTSVC